MRPQYYPIKGGSPIAMERKTEMILYFSVQNWSLLRSFMVFWVLSLVLYWPTAGAGFVTDTLGWFQTYKATGFTGVFNAFGDHSLHYIYHLVFFLLFKLFGFHGKGWMLMFTALHALVAALSLAFFRNLFSRLGIRQGKWIAWAGSLLFLVSPYQTETLVWYACVHYLLCSVFVLLALRAFTNYLERDDRKEIVAFYALFGLSVFTLEIGFGLPLLVAAFALLFPLDNYKVKQRGKLLLLFTLPSVALVVAYFLLVKLSRGSMAGHYGAATHFNLDPHLLLGNFSKYCAKLFTLSTFFSYEKRMALYAVFEKPYWAWLLIIAALAIAAGLIYYRNRLRTSTRLLMALILAFGFALAPAINLYFNALTLIEGDRFSYLAAVFGYMFLVLGIMTLAGRAGSLLVVVALVFNLHFFRVNVESWKHNKDVSENLLRSFSWSNAPQIYLLALPDNFAGSYMFRSFPTDDYFSRRLDLQYNLQVECKTIHVLQYNMQQVQDGVRVELVSDSDLKVCFNQWGNWWWYGSIGASNYQTENYEVTLLDGCYLLHLKRKQPGAVYLYQTGGTWHQVSGF